MHSILDALGGTNVRGLVTLGPLEAKDFSAPPNVVLERFVQHSAVLPQADAMVTQCGLGGLTKALLHGVPLVCVPLVGDQPDNAARVEAHGAGIALSGKASAREIRTALERLLTEPAYRHSASELGSRLLQGKAEEVAADEIESLAR